MNFVQDIPCTRDCPNRTATCHADCEAYAEFVIRNDNRRKEKFQANELERVFFTSKRKKT